MVLGKVDNVNHPEDGGGGRCHPGCEDTQSLEWVLQIIGHCYEIVVFTRSWILATIIWLKPGCSCVPRAAAAASLKARRPRQPLPDDSCLVGPGLISQISSNFLVLLGHFFGLQVSQFSNVSNSCLKCQLISIYQQRGRKLTCAAEEPATTTP